MRVAFLSSERGLAMTRWRWSIWLTFLTLWTLALLTPHPVYISKAVLPAHAQFPVAKCLHVGAYAFLTVLAGWLGVRGWRRWLLPAFLVCHAMATEYLQNFVPLRNGSWDDVGLDTVGIVIGLVLSWKWWWGE
jgi:VanZ family protein